VSEELVLADLTLTCHCWGHSDWSRGNKCAGIMDSVVLPGVLTQAPVAQVESYVATLLDWNTRMNLVAASQADRQLVR
jgi:hypothetical protein